MPIAAIIGMGHRVKSYYKGMGMTTHKLALFCGLFGVLACSRSNQSGQATTTNPPAADQGAGDGASDNAGNNDQNVSGNPQTASGTDNNATQSAENGNAKGGKTQTTKTTVSEKNTVANTADLSATHADPSTVVFHIKPGTGNGPWNDAANPIKVKVGQTLEVHNDDSVPHQFHTIGMPFGHPFLPMMPKSVSKFKIERAGAVGIHDHLTSGAIYMQAQ